MRNLSELSNQIQFDEENHRYSLGDHQFARSVTQICSSFCQKFDESSVVQETYRKHHNNPVSRYYQMTIEQILQLWEEIRTEASRYGTYVHQQLENFYNKVPYDTTVDVGWQIDQYLNECPKHWIPLIAECRVYSIEYDVAGCVDMIYRDSNTDRLIVVDWKTSKRIDWDNSFGRMMKPPFQDILGNKLNKYFLQLNIYRTLIEDLCDEIVQEMYIVCFNRMQTGYFIRKVPEWDKETIRRALAANRPPDGRGLTAPASLGDDVESDLETV